MILLYDAGRAKKCVKTMMIPTTAGTGAEATLNAIVAVHEKELKVGIVNPDMIPDYVVLDPVMIKNLPLSIAASTGVDTLCHAIECFTGNKANPFSDTFALDSLDKTLNNIVKACTNKNALEEKVQMQIAAYYGGIAITSSGTTAVHALSYPLGGKYHVAHGVSNAILLMPVMRFNEPYVKDRFALVYDRCVRTDKSCATVEQKSKYILSWMEDIVKELQIPTSLQTFNVPRSDLEKRSCITANPIIADVSKNPNLERQYSIFDGCALKERTCPINTRFLLRGKGFYVMIEWQ